MALSENEKKELHERIGEVVADITMRGHNPDSQITQEIYDKSVRVRDYLITLALQYQLESFHPILGTPTGDKALVEFERNIEARVKKLVELAA